MIARRVRRTLADRGLVRRGERVVVAVSGGPDSTALLHVLAGLAGELALGLVAVGVDHGLRAEAGVELDGAESVARALGIAFERVLITEAPTGASLHAWARRARYDALLAAAGRHGATHVATGHTADDQAETVLARALRGAGLRGLAGIDPARSDGVIRPLIDVSRAEVHAHLEKHALPFARDPANDASRFERARIRQRILPALLEEQPLAAARLVAIADEAREVDRALDAVARGVLARAAEGDALLLEPLRAAAPPIAKRALRRWAETRSARAIGRAHLVALEERLHGAGEVLLPGGWKVRREAEALRLIAPGNVGTEAMSTGLDASPEAQGSDEEE